MTGAEIIAGAQADGLVLSVEDGLLSIAGSAATIDLWRYELVTQKAEIVDLLQPAFDWRELALNYHQHHFKCPTCIAAGQGRGIRCSVGAALWTHFQNHSTESTHHEI